MLTKEEHDAVTYRRIWLRGIHFTKDTFFPENLVSATPFMFLGIWPAFKMTLAKPNYPWECSYEYSTNCRARHTD